MRKLMFILFNLLLVAYMIFALSFANLRVNTTLCTEVKITMIDTLNAGFLTKRDIEKLLLSGNSEILGYPVGAINIRRLEEKLLDLAYVKDAQVYKNMEGILKVDITQRKPVVRIITPSQATYYLDDEGYLFPPVSGFTPHVLVANGYFTEGSELKGVRSLEELKGNKKYDEWNETLKLTGYLQESSFWRSQIVQIYRNSMGDFELIPRVGAHQIIFGDTEDMEIKFKKLKTLYEEGLKYEGWNRYEKINLKYNNQVICTKR